MGGKETSRGTNGIEWSTDECPAFSQASVPAKFNKATMAMVECLRSLGLWGGRTRYRLHPLVITLRVWEAGLTCGRRIASSRSDSFDIPSCTQL
ncbi:hypothetical protein AVEN_213787-1 [Araneus ventricosus]|uniref:Uncharacterized protein n=1 Tax=Araneus ventricosus TaxID=182803 RepID=A0A4Y2K9D4_ARAVE|nr:hypothetical protein AVEN_213787-1 [Araneus ventricosus]